MKALVLLAALACFGSFAWAMKRFFNKPDGSTPGMKAIYGFGSLFSMLHLGLILLLYQFHPATTLAGLALYAAALALFWWSIQVNRTMPPPFAFSSDQPRHLVMSGPHRRMRHPFYCAYMLAWLAGVLAARTLAVADRRADVRLVLARRSRRGAQVRRKRICRSLQRIPASYLDVLPAALVVGHTGFFGSEAIKGG